MVISQFLRGWQSPKRTGVVLALGLFSGCLSAGMASAATNHQELFFAFVVERAGEADRIGAASTELSPADDSLKDGGVLSGDDVLNLALDTGDAQSGSSLFRDAELMAYLENSSTGERVRVALATCATLDFESANRAPFAQEVHCGEEVYSYGVSSHGLQVLKNAELMYAYKLAPGVYRLNGIVFSVED